MPTYHQLCYEVWQQHLRYPTLRDGQKPRHFMFPSPWRGRSPDLLFINDSPDQAAELGWAEDYDQSVSFARQFEFVHGGPLDRPHLHNTPMYGSLLSLARLVDERFGLWWQQPEILGGLLVEFVNMMPLATLEEDEDLNRLMVAGENQKSCQEILKGALDYYRPKVAIACGEHSQRLLHEIITGEAPEGSLFTKVLPYDELRCAAFFCGPVNLNAMTGTRLCDLVLALRRCVNQTGALN